ncbi:hypothetical protein [Neisseria animalis]|nr:hypothetical protein [Neisseria animalis]VEE08549.1 Uncharacterised protein [Neisseria animalis]
MNIFQIYYSSEQISKLDPEFIPVYNAPNPQERWFEYGVMRNLWQNHHHYFDDFVGVLSHKFYEKTGLTGKDVKAYITKHASQNAGGGEIFICLILLLLPLIYILINGDKEIFAIVA